MLVQLTDLHIREPGQLACGRIDTATMLRTAVQTVLRLRQQPQAVVITGDLTDIGSAGEYAHLAELLAPLEMPIYLMPGNHDERKQLRRSFAHHSWLHEQPDFVQYSVDVGALRLITLDTCVPGKSHGTLDAPRLRWLEKELEAHKHRPVIVAMHHPPFETLVGHMDGIGLLEGGPELEAIIARYPNVERVICGHLHRVIDVRFGGTIACTTPSPAHQVALDLAPHAAPRWIFEPPGFRIIAQDGNGRVVSHVAASGDFDGPYPFR